MKTKKTLQWTIARLKFDCTSPNNAFWGVSKRFGYRFQTVWIRYPFFGYGIHFLETVSIFWKRFPNEMDTVSNKWKRMFPLWIHLRSIHYGLVTIRNTLWGRYTFFFLYGPVTNFWGWDVLNISWLWGSNVLKMSLIFERIATLNFPTN